MPKQYGGDEAEYTPKEKRTRRGRDGMRAPEQPNLFAQEGREYLAEAQERIGKLTPLDQFEQSVRAIASDPVLQSVSAQAVARRESVRIGKQARDAAAADRAERIETLVPIARELARLSEGTEEPGITMADLRYAAVEKGVLRDDAPGRALSWLGAVMKATGLVGTGHYRRSHIAASHGVLQVVWRLPESQRTYYAEKAR